MDANAPPGWSFSPPERRQGSGGETGKAHICFLGDRGRVRTEATPRGGGLKLKHFRLFGHIDARNWGEASIQTFQTL